MLVTTKPARHIVPGDAVLLVESMAMGQAVSEVDVQGGNVKITVAGIEQPFLVALDTPVAVVAQLDPGEGGQPDGQAHPSDPVDMFS